MPKSGSYCLRVETRTICNVIGPTLTCPFPRLGPHRPGSISHPKPKLSHPKPSQAQVKPSQALANFKLPRRHDTLQIFFLHIPKLHVPSDCPTEFAPPTSPLTPPFRTLKTPTFCFLCFCCSDEIRPGDQTCPILGKTWSLGDQTRTILDKTCRHHLCHLHFGLLENRHCVSCSGP